MIWNAYLYPNSKCRCSPEISNQSNVKNHFQSSRCASCSTRFSPDLRKYDEMATHTKSLSISRSAPPPPSLHLLPRLLFVSLRRLKLSETAQQLAQAPPDVLNNKKSYCYQVPPSGNYRADQETE